MAGPCPGPYGGPREVGVSYERSTPVPFEGSIPNPGTYPRPGARGKEIVCEEKVQSVSLRERERERERPATCYIYLSLVGSTNLVCDHIGGPS